VKKSKRSFQRVDEFDKVCALKDDKPDNLDDCLCAFAKWVLSFPSLFEGHNDIIAAKAQRDVLCKQAGVPMYEWAPHTLTTYINAAAALHKLARPPICIVPKAKMQFPKFVRFVDAATKFSVQKAKGTCTGDADDERC
jgi:hypothetical protein